MSQSSLSHPSQVALLGLLASLILLADPVRANEPLTLERAIELARERNPDLLAARQELEIARGRLVKAEYWNQFNPEVEGGAAQRRFGAGGTAAQPAAGVALELEVGGQRGKRIEEAQRNLDRVAAEVANTERLLVTQLKEAFYRSLYLGRRRQLSGEVEDLNRRLRDAATERFKSGEVPKLEANLAVVRYSEARKETLAAERDHRNSLRDIERLIGREPLDTTELTGDLAVHPLTLEPDALVATALEVRPDLRARDAEIKRVDAETALTHRLIIPNPTLRGGYDEETESPGSRPDQIIGGRLSIPLPVFDRRQGELTALAGHRAQAAHERSATTLAVQAEVRDAYRSYMAARDAVAVFEADALGRVRESFGFVETAYRQGKIDLLQLIVVQNDLVGAQLSYLNSLWDYWLARIALERAIGQPLEQGAHQ